MKAKIENPKVFISYAWASKEYENKVIAFVSSLIDVGIDVIFDKFNLTEGNDTHAFMEQSVNDPTVTNVLLLLDPVYAEKANDHKGGVGTETQIISPQVYNEVNQEKFIPVIFERDENGNVCKPTYLVTRFHIDLSVAEKYDEEYKKLVRRLYGIETYEKPPLGKKPAWVESPEKVEIKNIVSYDVLKGNVTDAAKKEKYASLLHEIEENIISFIQKMPTEINNQEYVNFYSETNSIRDNYLMLLKYYIYVDKSDVLISAFLENLFNRFDAQYMYDIKFSTNQINLAKILIHELFICTIAYLLKKQDYKASGNILKRTYFKKGRNEPETFCIFRTRTEGNYFDDAIREIDNKNYHSGVANFWIKNINTDIFTKDDFVFADLICFNFSVFGNVMSNEWYWFPITYVYDNQYTSVLGSFGKHLISKEFFVTVLPLFGFEKAEDFIIHYKEIEDSLKNGRTTLREYRFHGCYNPAPLLCDTVKSDQIATLN